METLLGDLGVGSKVIGSKGLESSLIGTVAHCELCNASTNWLGNFSPVNKIKNSGLWLFQHLDNNSINNKEVIEVKNLINRTLKQIKNKY